MIKNQLIYKNHIQLNLKKNIKKRVNAQFKNISNKILKNIDDYEDTFHVLSKKFELSFNLKELKKFKKYNSIIIIGMGGSILGTEAIFQFLRHKIKKKFYFINDINETRLKDLKKKNDTARSLFIIVSKSGNTIETLSNFISLNILKKNAKNIIIVSEKKDNLLHDLAKKFNLFYIEHKKYLGGRFSVLSEVGMLPASLMGVNINKLRFNLIKNLQVKKNNFLNESCLKLSEIIKLKKYNNLVLLNYVPQMEKFLFWCQQLIAESLGKKKMGFFPVVSNNPKDHHSLLQLYLDGPKDKLFCIFSLEENSKTKIKTKRLLKKLSYLNNKNLTKIKNVQKEALIKVFKKNKIPYREFKIKSLKEETLGELFSYFILETAITGKLLKINPFDQPAVEQVKVLTKKILK